MIVDRAAHTRTPIIVHPLSNSIWSIVFNPQCKCAIQSTFERFILLCRMPDVVYLVHILHGTE